MTEPFIPFTNVAKVDMCWSQLGQRTMNSLYFRHTSGAIDEADLTALAESMAGWYALNLQDSINVSTSLRLVRVTDLTTETSAGVEYNPGTGQEGTAAGQACPNNVALVVKITTGLRGRSYRGRVFQGGIPVSALNGNEVLTAYANAINVAYFNLITEPPADWELGVASRQHNMVRRTTGVFTPAISCSVDLAIDSQRRRLEGRGE